MLDEGLVALKALFIVLPPVVVAPLVVAAVLSNTDSLFSVPPAESPKIELGCSRLSVNAEYLSCTGAAVAAVELEKNGSSLKGSDATFTPPNGEDCCCRC